MKAILGLLCILPFLICAAWAAGDSSDVYDALVGTDPGTVDLNAAQISGCEEPQALAKGLWFGTGALAINSKQFTGINDEVISSLAIGGRFDRIGWEGQFAVDEHSGDMALVAEYLIPNDTCSNGMQHWFSLGLLGYVYEPDGGDGYSATAGPAAGFGFERGRWGFRLRGTILEGEPAIQTSVLFKIK